MSSVAELQSDLKSLATPERAKVSAWFFKTGPGQYGEGDIFIGVTVPDIRKVAKNYRDLSLADLEKLLESEIHEERQVAVMILVNQFKRGDVAIKKSIYDFYLAHATRINNWDMVDGSAEFIVGPWLQDKDRSILTKLAKSENIWERRISMMATFHYIKQGDSTESFKIATLLLHDRHDLIQKAVGWMLREIGKRCSQEIEEEFLRVHYKIMLRTMLRYAIERFSEEERQKYLKGLV